MAQRMTAAPNLGLVTMEVLVRPKGSADEPRVVGELQVDLNGKVPPAPAPIPPLPTPTDKDA